MTLTIVLDEADYAYNTLLTMLTLIVFTTNYNEKKKQNKMVQKGRKRKEDNNTCYLHRPY